MKAVCPTHHYAYDLREGCADCVATRQEKHEKRIAEVKAEPWRGYEPDLDLTAHGAALDQWAMFCGTPARASGETDDELRQRIQHDLTRPPRVALGCRPGSYADLLSRRVPGVYVCATRWRVT